MKIELREIPMEDGGFYEIVDETGKQLALVTAFQLPEDPQGARIIFETPGGQDITVSPTADERVSAGWDVF